MTLSKIVPIAIVLWLGTACAESHGTRIEQLEGGYAVELPIGFKVSKRDNMPDFLVYEVADKKGKESLLIYLGDFPDDQLNIPNGAIRSSSTVGGYEMKSIRWSENDGTSSGSTLLRLGNNGEHPAFAHIIFQRLSKPESQIAERILRTFHRVENESKK